LEQQLRKERSNAGTPAEYRFAKSLKAEMPAERGVLKITDGTTVLTENL
jgi:hypothetical protein